MACNIQKELNGIHLGDERLDRRIAVLAGRLAASPALSVSGACAGWAETMAGYRLVHSEEVTLDKVLHPHREATLERARACGESLLLVQDTTELDYTTHKSMHGAGPLSSVNRRGFFLHNHLLIAEESAVPLGLCGAQILTRTDAEHGKAMLRKKLPLKAKESMRWMLGYSQACAVAQALPTQEVIMVADRECDIYEIFAEHDRLLLKNAPLAQFIIRASADRNLGKAMLFATAKAAPLLGAYELEVQPKVLSKKTPAGSRRRHLREGRKKAIMEVRATRVKLPAPYRSHTKLPAVELTVILACEKDPPEGQSAICWVLLSTLPSETLSAALRILRAYTLRWRVEEFHRILKTGCRVEALSFVEATSIHALLAMYMIVAWRILYLRDFARACPESPGSVFFTQAEWKSACIMKRRSLEHAPPLGELMRIVAAFGGYHGHKNDPPPGPELLWRGLVKLHHYAEMAAELGAL